MIKTAFPDIKALFWGKNIGGWIDISKWCIGFSVNYNMNSPSANFSITLKRAGLPFDWKKIIPNDLLKVFLSKDGEMFPSVTPGFVSRAQRGHSLNPANVSDNITITGKSAGKYFENHEIIYMPQLGKDLDDVFLGLYPLKLDGRLPRDKTSPDQLCKIITETRLFSDFQELNDGKKLDQYVSLEKVEDVNKGAKYRQELLAYSTFFFNQGPVWQMIKNYSNPILNELFFVPEGTTSDAKTYLVLRPRPFNSSDFPEKWDELKNDWQVIELSFNASNINQIQLGKSDDEVYNLWMIENSMSGVNNNLVTVFLTGSAITEKIRLPIFNRKSAMRYGVKKYFTSTPFIPTRNQEGNGLCLEASAFITKRVYEWYSQNDEMESGSINVVGGIPELKLGSAIVDTDTKTEYYCEGFSHNYSPGKLQTMLNLTRGINPKTYDQNRLVKLQEAGM